jgi:thiol:disulfide interchange protein DsbG
MPRLRHLLTLLPLSLAATLAQAEEWPAPIKQIEAKGAKIIGKFDAPSGLTGYAAQYQNRGMALYLTADGKRARRQPVRRQGNDLSSAPLEKLVYAPMAKESGPRWKRATGSRTATKRTAHRLPVQRPQLPVLQHVLGTGAAMGESRQGAVAPHHGRHHPRRQPRQVRRPARRQRPAKALEEHEAAGKGSKLKALDKIPADIEAKLAANMQLMEDWSCRPRRRFSIWMTRAACSNSKGAVAG